MDAAPLAVALLAFVGPEAFLVVIPALLITIYGVYEHGLPRHRKAAIAALVFLTAILVVCTVPLVFEVSRWLQQG
jgi:hypothetical protein